MQAPTPEICVKPVLERDDFDDTSEAFWHSVSLLATLLSMMMMSMITMMMMVKVFGDDDGHDDIEREEDHRDQQLHQDHEAALGQTLKHHRNLVVH